jgi:pimeloyl-ACP methyl ester carboxylesterase
VELRHHETELRGLRVHWVEAGAGPPLLLVHGLLVSHLEWLPVIEQLAGSFRCIAPDLPGFGKSDKPGERHFPYTREAFADTLRELLRALGVERAHVVGHSLGGAVALTFAADHAASVDRLALIDTAVYEFRLPVKGRIPLVPVLGPLVFKRLYGRSMFRAYFEDDVFNGHDGVDLARVDQYYEDFDSKEGREAAYAALVNTLDVTSLLPRIPRVKAPTLVIWGDEDRLVPVGLGHRLAREIPNARLSIVERSGHAPNEEHAARTAKLLLDHFSGER